MEPTSKWGSVTDATSETWARARLSLGGFHVPSHVRFDLHGTSRYYDTEDRQLRHSAHAHSFRPPPGLTSSSADGDGGGGRGWRSRARYGHEDRDWENERYVRQLHEGDRPRRTGTDNSRQPEQPQHARSPEPEESTRNADEVQSRSPYCSHTPGQYPLRHGYHPQLTGELLQNEPQNQQTQRVQTT
eukprot:6792777-Alexandrium_andersonii.AAC.1